MKKTFVKVLVCIFTVVSVFPLLSACMKDKKSSNEIRIVLESANADTYQIWFDEFEELYAEQGYKVSVIPVGGGQTQGKQQNMIAEGSAPDIIVGGDVHILSQNKYLYPLNDLIARDASEVEIDDFIPEIIDLLKYQGETLYLPNFFNSSLLYYNTDLFDAYNADPNNSNNQITYPTVDWTYNDFLSTAKKLTVKTGGAYSQFGCFSGIGWWGEWLIHVRQSGAEVMNEQGFVTLDTDAAEAGFTRYMNKMYGDDKVSYVTGELDLGGFTGKKTAMLYGGHINEWIDYSKVADFNWDVQLLPTVDGNRTGELAVDGLGIYKNSNAVDASWALIKYLTRKKTGDVLKNYPIISSRISEKEELLNIPYAERNMPRNLEAVYGSISHNKILPQQRYFTYVMNQIVQTELTKTVQNTTTIRAALKSATDKSNNYIRANYS